jgi:glycosyltransferase involved in cell wall biosynthesis
VKTSKIGVLHLVDTLAAGGAEHVAVMLANNLPQDRYRVYFCASRQAGPLQSEIQSHIMFYDLRRKGRFDVFAIIRLAEFIRHEHIGIIHAHTTSLFLGAILTLVNPRLKLVWHDHAEQKSAGEWRVLVYRPFVRQAQAVFTVTRGLARWAVLSLGLPKDRVLYLPNFVEAQQPICISLVLPGVIGKRLVCVANIRSQKDHLTLLQAFNQVIKDEPQAHLLLVGAESDSYLAEQVRQESWRLGLESNLTFLGPREDVPLILANCDIGVISSVSAGFPVVLLEYGRAGLAVVATQVGECAEILEEGEAGLLVPPSNPDSLAAALLRLLKSPALRTQLGEQLDQRVKQNYGVKTIVSQVCQVYEQII